jgi:polar amino acid transport system substrate-binding protein
MKKMLVLLILVLSLSSFAETVRLTTGQWPPYLSEKLNDGGFGTAIVTAAFEEVGVNVEYVYLPWKRAFSYAEDGKDVDGGKINGTILWVRTPEREKSFYYTKPVVSDPLVIYYAKKKPIEWDTLDDLIGTKIGLTLHAKYPVFENYAKKDQLNFERLGGYDILFKRLLAGRIDAIPYETNVAGYFMRTTLSAAQRDRIAYNPKPLSTRKFHLILTKAHSDNTDVRDKFNKGLDMIYSNGVYDKIKAKFDNGYYDK